MNYDLIIVGSGPAGIFTALELIKRGTKKKMLLIEKGKPVEKRHCPKAEVGHCVNCKPSCAITTGFSGAGAFSDGKLSLSYEVGGDLPMLIGEDFAQELINYTDKIYLEFGADTKIEGINTGDAIKEIRKNAIKAGLKLVDCPIRHLGTEKAQELYLKIQNFLADNDVDMMFSTECKNIIIEDSVCKGVIIDDKGKDVIINAPEIVIATGRRGADWLDKLCIEHNIAHKPGTVDIGVRVECRNEVMEKVNEALYESKLIGYPRPWKNKVRTFCQNPGGFVAQENYDNDLAVVNGHSFKDKKSENTNLAILVSHNFTEPFNQPIEYAQKVGELTNMLGAGHIMVQRFGDILDGKRTWQYELNKSNVKPTLKDAVAGDITAAMPYRAMTNIIEFIKMLDIVVPGFASTETLLYSPELKFYSNKVKMDENLNTNIKGLHCLGDSSGWTRGLMMASVMGVLMEIVIATGRRGADWLDKLCIEHNIAHKPGTVDIGVRVECRNEVMEKVNEALYESKLIGYPRPWKNKVRTFCQNPGGFVAQENYDNDLAVVNGHSFKDKKSENTNLAILVSHNFTEPFNQPIEYAQKVGELTNMLGAGHIMVQRFGDILDGKRTWQYELNKSNVKPTLKDAVAGDITAAMPYRAMTNIIEFIKMLDIVVPGFASTETLLYSPELKFYSNKVKMDENLNTNIKGLHCLGDSSGWTRGLMMASVMGVLMGQKLSDAENN